jgi:hypothetical protein
MLKKYRFTFILVALLAIYLGWFYHMRWSTKKALIEKLDEQKPQSQQLSDIYGDGSVTVLLFYTTAASIAKGQTIQLCYGVISAESVRIEPPVGDIWPSASRCVDITPQKDTTYRLFAEDADGNSVTAETSIQVRPE